MTLIEGRPPVDAVYLDEHHGYVVVEYPPGTPAGINEFHWVGDHWCYGFIAFENYDPSYFWHVESMDPLTLSPSLLCRACGSHGFIREGRWVGV